MTEYDGTWRFMRADNSIIFTKNWNQFRKQEMHRMIIQNKYIKEEDKGDECVCMYVSIYIYI